MLERDSLTDWIGDSLVTREPQRTAMPLLDIDPSFLNKTNRGHKNDPLSLRSGARQTKKERKEVIKINTNGFYML